MHSFALQISGDDKNENSQDLIWEVGPWATILEIRQGLISFPYL